MENHEADITKVKLESDRVCAKLESWIDPGRPYTLAVRLVEEDRLLDISVYPVMKIRRNSNAFRMLANFNNGLPNCISMAVNKDREAIIKIGYPCEDCGSSPSPQIVYSLIDECIGQVRALENLLVYAAMTDAGIGSSQTRLTVKALFAEKFNSFKGQNTNTETKNHNGGDNQ